MDDAKRRADLGSLREVLHEKVVTVHPPPTELYSHAASFRFPELTATSLDGTEVALGAAVGRHFAGRWTLLGCSGSNFSQGMVDAWIAGVTADAPSDGELQACWLSLVEGTVLGWLRTPLLASMRRGVPTERHSRFLCRFEDDTTDLRRTLQMTNRYLGYVCLVDPQGTVRWHVHGSEVPSEEQVSGLRGLIEQALKFEGGGACSSGAVAAKPAKSGGSSSSGRRRKR